MDTQVKIRRGGRIRRFAIAAAIGVSSLALPAAAAAAQDEPYSDGGPDVLPTRLEVEDPQDSSSEAASRPSGGILPVTGAELTLFAVTGLAAIRTGAIIVRRTRP